MCAVTKGGEVCLSDSDFLPETHFPQSENLKPKAEKPPNLQTLEQLVIYLKNPAPWQPPCCSTPSWILMVSISRANAAACCVKHILKIFPHLNRGYVRKARGQAAPTPQPSSPGRRLFGLGAAGQDGCGSRIDGEPVCLLHNLTCANYSHSGKVPALLPAQEV